MPPAVFCYRQPPHLPAQPEQPAQLPQFPPQEDFPCRLSRIIERTISATTAHRTSATAMLPQLAANQTNTGIPPFHKSNEAQTLTFAVSLVASLYGRKSSQMKQATTAIATIRPRTFRLPVSAPPIWLMTSATR